LTPLRRNVPASLEGRLQAQGELAAAESQYRRALPLLERSLGEEHPRFCDGLMRELEIEVPSTLRSGIEPEHS